MRFIQVGVGGMGNVWVNCMKNDRRVEVAGLVDVVPDNLKKASEALGIGPEKCFSSMDEALAKAKADALIIVTPPAFHKDQVIAGLKAGLDVVCEKPMANSLEECRMMVQASVETGKTCVITQNYRYSPQMYTLGKLLRSGLIGDVGQIRCDFWKGVDFGGGFRHSMDYPVLIDMSIHHFDLLRFLSGLDAIAVTGQSWNPPWSNYKGDCSSSVQFEMSNGVRALYNASWCAKGDYCDWNGNWLIEGSKGSLTYSNGAITYNAVPGLYKIEKSETMQLDNMDKTAQTFILDNFISSMESGTRPLTDVFDNIQSISMVFAAVEAVKSGNREKIALDKYYKKCGISAEEPEPAFA